MTTRGFSFGFAVTLLLLACGDIDRQPRQPNERPVAQLVVASEVSVGEPTLLDGSGSSDEDGQVVSYRFAPGDSDEELITSESRLLYTYTEVGDFTVTLTVVDDRGGKDSAASTIRVLGAR